MNPGNTDINAQRETMFEIAIYRKGCCDSRVVKYGSGNGTETANTSCVCKKLSNIGSKGFRGRKSKQ